MPERRELYSESEVGEIIRRAVEMQESAAAPTYTPGVTRDELERIAKEMGVDAAFIRKALEQRQGSEPPKSKKIQFAHEVERVVEGELDPNDFDLVTSALPPSTDRSPPSQVGRALNAKMMVGMSMADVTVSSRNGRTRVKVRTNPLLNIIFGLQSGLLGTAIGAGLMSDKGAIGAGIALIVAGLAGMGALLISGVKGSAKTAEKIANDVVEKIQEELPAAAEGEPALVEEPHELRQGN